MSPKDLQEAAGYKESFLRRHDLVLKTVFALYLFAIIKSAPYLREELAKLEARNDKPLVGIEQVNIDPGKNFPPTLTIEKPIEKDLTDPSEGAHIRVDLNGKIVGLVTSEVNFSIDPAKAEKARERAIKEGTYQVVDVFTDRRESYSAYQFGAYGLNQEYLDNKNHPFLTELPDDVLSEEELAERGVEIIQGNQAKLFIRSGAFREGQVLEGYSKDGRKLRIVNIESIALFRQGIPEGKYQDVRHIIPEFPKDALREAIELKAEFHLNEAKKEAMLLQGQNPIESHTAEENYMSNLVLAEATKRGKVKDRELISFALENLRQEIDLPHYAQDILHMGGFYLPLSGYDYIFINTNSTTLNYYHALIVKPDGSFDYVRTGESFGRPFLQKGVKASIPDSNDSYWVDEEGKKRGYIRYPMNAGQIFHHEAVHAHGNRGPGIVRFVNKSIFIVNPAREEHLTDKETIEREELARRKWETGDDSDLHFLYQVPSWQTEGTEPRYQLF